MRRGFTLVELLVVIVIIAALAGLTAPQVIKMKKKGDLAEATNNARQMGLGFTQFDADIGGYPDDDSVEAVEALIGESSSVHAQRHPTPTTYFRQLVVAGIVDSEQPFFSRTSYIKSKPDDLMKDTELLKGGRSRLRLHHEIPGRVHSDQRGQAGCRLSAQGRIIGRSHGNRTL